MTESWGLPKQGIIWMHSMMINQLSLGKSIFSNAVNQADSCIDSSKPPDAIESLHQRHWGAQWAGKVAKQHVDFDDQEVL